MNINIISFHGLKSQGDNLEILVNHLESDMESRGIDVVTSQTDYPTLGVWEGRRKWARKIVPLFMLEVLAKERLKFPGAKLYVLCHSNGTFGMMNALHEYNRTPWKFDKIRIDKLFLFGSVIPRCLRWAKYPHIDVINFVGSKDMVSGVARLYGMSNSGKKGFKHEADNLKQYYTDWGHSGFVEPENYEFIRDIVLEGVNG